MLGGGKGRVGSWSGGLLLLLLVLWLLVDDDDDSGSGGVVSTATAEVLEMITARDVEKRREMRR